MPPWFYLNKNSLQCMWPWCANMENIGDLHGSAQSGELKEALASVRD